MPLLVPRAALQEAESAAAVAASRFIMGDPRCDSTTLGPLVSVRQRDRVRQHIDRAVADGARVVCGGSEPTGHSTGYFVRPTVLSDVTPDLAIAREEVFGPVLTIIPYDSIDEAVTIANSTDCGLSAAVWGSDDTTLRDVARRLRSGQVIINGGAWNFVAPFGGYKKSGLGRESGTWGLEEFLEVKALRSDRASSAHGMPRTQGVGHADDEVRGGDVLPVARTRLRFEPWRAIVAKTSAKAISSEHKAPR
ncbi:aldehyde dehydrogenase family protein [Nocardioides eburneiflavus]|uniref:Aldehyde dehydrogenase family protein n=2 Tax=Nocardioides eburneiflavus TaxID=2518372 RepID=A0A4Z1CPJ2_9ACTN|nr:aldehyde dehydrogenase family protein [Nocardioides eburneiflavus]